MARWRRSGARIRVGAGGGRSTLEIGAGSNFVSRLRKAGIGTIVPQLVVALRNTKVRSSRRKMTSAICVAIVAGRVAIVADTY